MINWLFFCSFIFSMVMTFLGVLLDMSYELEYKPAIEQFQSQQTDLLNDYFSDEVYFKKHPLFGRSSTEKKDFTHKIHQQDATPYLIDPKIKKDILSLGSQWLNQKHRIPRSQEVDRFFIDIQDYDHFNITHPIPSGFETDLLALGQIFLAETFFYKPQAIREALEKLRHLSQVLLSAQNMNVKKIGLSLLEKEKEFSDFIASRLNQGRFLWTPIPTDEIKHFRLHLGKTLRLLSPLSTEGTIDKVFMTPTLPLGFCAAFKEKEKLILWSEAFLGPQFILEANFSTSAINIAKLKKKAAEHCLPTPNLKTPQYHWAQSLPFYRRIFGLKMILNAEHRSHPL